MSDIRNPVKEFTIDLNTDLVVDWEDSEGPKRVTIEMGFPEIVAALLVAPNNWGTLTLINRSDGSSIVWCDGTTSAQHIHSRNTGASKPPANPPIVDRPHLSDRRNSP